MPLTTSWRTQSDLPALLPAVMHPWSRHPIQEPSRSGPSTSDVTSTHNRRGTGCHLWNTYTRKEAYLWVIHSFCSFNLIQLHFYSLSQKNRHYTPAHCHASKHPTTCILCCKQTGIFFIDRGVNTNETNSQESAVIASHFSWTGQRGAIVLWRQNTAESAFLTLTTLDPSTL